MSTDLLYMGDFDVVTCAATVLTVSNTDDDRIDLVLNQTCFDPRGGGQDWDTGSITNGSTTFSVDEVRLDEEGTVHHLGQFVTGAFEAGTAVNCSVDQTRRKLNTRIHSGGHVIDMAVAELRLPWIPGKGAHYPHMSFVEYQGKLNAEQSAELQIAIETSANNALGNSATNTIRFMPVEEMHAICRHVPENIPQHKPARVVIYGDNFGVPCGGTHVEHLSEIGKLRVTKIKRRSGTIKVSYAVE